MIAEALFEIGCYLTLAGIATVAVWSIITGAHERKHNGRTQWQS